MQIVTMKADRQVGSISVPSGNEAPPFTYRVRENGTVEVPEAHVPHLRGAGFKPMDEIEQDRLRQVSHDERVAQLLAQIEAEKARGDAAEAALSKSAAPAKK